ncbi:hypothetical protein [Amycolatopsis silviterrae]|uniref:Uncharacterized protein n=1 Tax=Amycolatopsis silviterrae TaxID=1656914 RepID=A0ABW5HMA9_9PSEU
MLLAVGDPAGNSAVISVTWTSFANRTDADAFENLEAVLGSGDITPLAVIAETETIGGHVNDDVLDALAEVAVWLPKP